MITLLTILLLNWPIDKIYHFGAGATISFTINKTLKNPTLGLYAGHIAGLTKEAIDYRQYGKYDLKDASATTSGAFFTFIVWFRPKPFKA